MKAILKAVFIFLVAGVPVFSAGVQPVSAEIKYAFVDVARIFDDYEKTKTNDQQLQDLGRQKEEQRENMVQEIRQLKDELTLLAEDAKEEKQDAVNKKVQALQDFERDTRRELGQQRDRVVKEIFKDIDDTVQRYGERKGVDLIFNERALVYRNDKLDITEEILGDLNKEYASKKN
ncbi:MAG: hypothetical protein A2Z83_00110 [Omnitrophica bacterium GWA2_52_8]|nr:MAG: hypothetical protein A2Z83_00110 [Omnitrophica bacterium GWA2_52_8]